MSQESNLNSRLSHLDADTDQSITAIHHTLGPAPTQASPGSHRHDGSDSVRIKATDLEGDIPAANGLPAGGEAGQILAKDTAADYDAIWVDNNAAWTSQLKHEVKLGESISKGQAVYVSSADGTNMIVSKASNATEATSSKTLGLLESGGSTNAKVKVITEGLLSGLNTSTATAGDPVWLGTAGNLIYGLASKPVAPAHLVFIGVVTRSNSSNGEIFVKPQNGFEFNELHDVLIVSKTNGDLIQYESSSGLWKNKPQSTLTIAPSQVTGTAVITSDSRLSDARTPTAHASTHTSGGSDAITVAQSQVTGLTTALSGKASTTHSATHGDGGTDPVYIEQAQVTGLTTSLSNKASTTHASTHASGSTDPITIAASQVTGTAVVTADSRLSDARTPTAHASTHLTGGSDEIVIDIAQVAGLTSALSGKASSTHVHGNISNTGTLATSVTATNPVKVVITNSSDTVGTLTTTGASGTTFLRGDGTWNTPVRGFVGSFETTAASSSSAVSLAPADVSTSPAAAISVVGGATTNITGVGGGVNVTGGAASTGTSTATGGSVTIRGGASNTTNGVGGNVTINGGQGSGANGNGDITIGSTTTDSVTIGASLTLTNGISGALNLNNASSPLQVQGSAGTSGTVLTSAGSGATPTWTAVPAAAIKVAANRTTSVTGTTALAVNTGETFAITFPASRFSVSPSVTASTSSVRYVAAVTVVTTSGFTLSVRNVSDATGTTYLYHWQAIEIVAGMGN